MSNVADDPITFACTLEARRETVYFFARLVHERCARLGTRAPRWSDEGELTPGTRCS
jgi:hypothetical protein